MAAGQTPRFGSSFAGAAAPPAVLVADEHEAARKALCAALESHGVRAHEAGNGSGALALARACALDLAFLDQGLCDRPGLVLGPALAGARLVGGWILTSRQMHVKLAVAAMRAGAIDALPLPFDIQADGLPHIEAVWRQRRARWPRLPRAAEIAAPRSPLERVAACLLLTCAAHAEAMLSGSANPDMKTVRIWAASQGRSRSSLTKVLERSGLRPSALRDLTRALCLLWISDGRLDEILAGLDVEDSRTVEAFVERAGLSGRPVASRISFEDFLDLQPFVPPGHALLKALLALLQRST